MAIDVFQKLDIFCPAAEVDDFMDALTNMLDGGWVRAFEVEERVRSDAGFTSLKYYCFKCDASDDRRAATLWINENEGILSVFNIVPKTQARLSISEFNDILNEFNSKYVKPLSDRMCVEVHLSKAQESIDDWAAPETVKALKLFSGCANKSTGRAHPLDDERWMNFVITAHNINDKFHSEDLRRWLVQEEKWQSELAWELCSDYEYGRNLLKKYGR